MARVATRSRATADLRRITQYLRREAGPKVANDYREHLKDAFRRLSNHPESGVERPNFGLGVRLVTINPYVVLYRFDQVRGIVFVLRVLHRRRRLSLDAP